MPIRHTVHTYFTVLALAASLTVSASAENLIQDPGFERFRLDEKRGCYVPTENAVWVEDGAGVSSVVFDASDWNAPKQMLAAGPLGFTPGTKGHDGLGREVNSGVLVFQQNVVLPEDAAGKLYEAWVWLGGAGKDDDAGADRKEENGGWEIRFFGSDDPTTWESSLEQPHSVSHDYHGKPESFVRVSGYGRIPEKARGFRIRTWARTWSPSHAQAHDTQVALDNAHFAVLRHPNLLKNGNFEEDTQPTEFIHWDRPAKHAFAHSTLEPLKVNDAYNTKKNWDHNFDHGLLLPFNGDKFAYGYVTFLRGWKKDGFTFSQDVRYDAPTGTPLTLTCNWIQNTPNMHDAVQFRDGAGSQLNFVLQYFDGEKELTHEKIEAKWPVATHPENRCGKDQNPWLAYNPRFEIVPPDNTNRIRLNVQLMVDLEHQDGRSHVACAVDDFYLGLANPPK